MSQLQLPESAPNSADNDAGKALSFPIGMASPLWAAYAGAAAAGAAFWWMSRWTRVTNLEALVGLPSEAALEMAAPMAEAIAEAVPVVAETLVETAPESVAGAVAEIVAAADIAPAPAADGVDAGAPDDLTRIVGIGPKLSMALAERGLTTFAKLASLEAADLAVLDKDLDLKGRAVRDAWVAQAARFAQLH